MNYLVSLVRCNWQIENTTCRIVQKILYLPNRTNPSNGQVSTRIPEYREIFQVSLMPCKSQIEDSTWRIVQKLIYSPNGTNRSNRQACTQVPEYRGIFLSVANEMQMADRKLYFSSKKFSICQIEQSDQIELLFFPIESSWQYWTTLRGYGVPLSES